MAQFDNHNSQVWRVSWNITGTVLASSGDDGCVRLWKGKNSAGLLLEAHRLCATLNVWEEVFLEWKVFRSVNDRFLHWHFRKKEIRCWNMGLIEVSANSCYCTIFGNLKSLVLPDHICVQLSLFRTNLYGVVVFACCQTQKNCILLKQHSGNLAFFFSPWAFLYFCLNFKKQQQNSVAVSSSILSSFSAFY